MKKFEKIYNKIITEEFDSQIINDLYKSEKATHTKAIDDRLISDILGWDAFGKFVNEYVQKVLPETFETKDSLLALEKLVAQIVDGIKTGGVTQEILNPSVYKGNTNFIKPILKADIDKEFEQNGANTLKVITNGTTTDKQFIVNILTKIIRYSFFDKYNNFIVNNINLEKVKSYIAKVATLFKQKEEIPESQFEKCVKGFEKELKPALDKLFTLIFNKTFEEVLNVIKAELEEVLFDYYTYDRSFRVAGPAHSELNKFIKNNSDELFKVMSVILLQLYRELGQISIKGAFNVRPIIKEIFAKIGASDIKDEDLLVLSADKMSKYKNNKSLRIDYPIALFMGKNGKLRYILQFTNGYYDKQKSMDLAFTNFYNLASFNSYFNNFPTSVTEAFSDNAVSMLIAIPKNVVDKVIEKTNKRHQNNPFKTRENFDEYNKRQLQDKLTVFKRSNTNRQLKKQVEAFIANIPETFKDFSERLNKVGLIQSDSAKQRLVTEISDKLYSILSLNERINNEYNRIKDKLNDATGIVDNYTLRFVDNTAKDINDLKQIIDVKLNKLEGSNE